MRLLPHLPRPLRVPRSLKLFIIELSGITLTIGSVVACLRGIGAGSGWDDLAPLLAIPQGCKMMLAPENPTFDVSGTLAALLRRQDPPPDTG